MTIKGALCVAVAELVNAQPAASGSTEDRASEAAVEQTACKFESCPPHISRQQEPTP